MSSVVEISQIIGPMWSVAGRGVVVPTGEPVPGFLLAEVFSSVEGPGPWRVRATDGGEVFDLVLGLDGSVSELVAQTPGEKSRLRGSKLQRGVSGIVSWLRRWWWALALAAAVIAVIVIIVLMVAARVSGGSSALGALVLAWDGGIGVGRQ